MPTETLDVAAVKEDQQRMWASGDYAAIAIKIVYAAETLVENADVPAGSRVLDVAAGTGNAALAAARGGWCRVVATDYVPELLARAKTRAAAEGVALEVVEADAEALPFEDGSFDAVLSVFGCMFAPDHERAAAELVRVCRPAGTIGLASWTPHGFVADFFRVVARYAPPPPGLRPPTFWGTEEHVRELLGGSVSELRTARRAVRIRTASPAELADLYLRAFGPVVTAAGRLDDEGREAFRTDLAGRWSARADASSIPAEYLEVVATRA